MARSILLVDDSASFRQVVALALTRSGYETTQAVDGKDGLTKVQAKRYDLIVSDINMPNMNGLDFLKALKLHPNGKFTPVVMLTTETAPAKMAEAKASGAKAWISKPFEPPQLLNLITTLVRA
jgi:two-component system chemotaxis response regulator CheY